MNLNNLFDSFRNHHLFHTDDPKLKLIDDTCESDLGSPIWNVYDKGNGKSVAVLIGLLSKTSGCQHPLKSQTMSEAVNVTKVMPWIRKNIKDVECSGY